MKKILALIFTTVLILTSFAFAEEKAGSLVIVGGALRGDNDAVYEKFIELAGGKDKAKIAVVPAASGNPDKYFKLFRTDMTSRGVKEENVLMLKLALQDDKKTKDVDESTWKNNGNSLEEVARLEGVTAIWFVGGDQLKITGVLFNQDKSNTKVLNRIWEIYKSGGVIGGSSAGAAIMSDVMIAGGDSLGVLQFGHAKQFDQSSLDYQNQGGLVIDKGFGFFTDGIVDQHFDRKGRLGRLAVVAYENKAKYPVAYGVEENTALIYNSGTKMIEVAGPGGVVVVDVKRATKDAKGNYKNIKISYLDSVDRYDIKMNKALMGADKYTTIGYEYNETKNPLSTGAVSANASVKNMIGFDLVDNLDTKRISSYLFDQSGNGFEFLFYKIPKVTEGYWGQNGAADLYSFENVGLDITKMKATIKTLR